MQIVIDLDPESARQLVEIQTQTDRDHSTIFRTGIERYHHQIQQSDRIQLAQHKQIDGRMNSPVFLEDV
jgi:predicted transcriptional regulator